MNPNRHFVLLYGAICYLLHWVVTLFLIAFVGNLWVRKTVDGGPGATASLSAVCINLALLTGFVAQHWIMARPWFKKLWTKWIPEPIERSTYVLMTCLTLCVLFYLWRPATGKVWEASSQFSEKFLVGVYFAGWILAIIATFPINHWELFGIRQTWLFWRGIRYSPPKPKPSIIYRVLPHPIFVGYGIAVWATPRMGWAHFTLSTALTAFILVDLKLAEGEQ